MIGVTGYLSNIFGKSPFKPVQMHMDLCVRAAALVAPLVEHASKSHWEEVALLQREISSLEGEADEFKSGIRMNLPRGFLLPVARADLLDLLTRQDNIANRAEDIAGLIFGRTMEIPPVIAEAMNEYAQTSVDTCELAGKVVSELDELVDSRFSGREAKQVSAMIEAVGLRERDSDKQQVDLRQQLFAVEVEIPPVEVMFLYQVIDLIGDLADIAERVGHRVQMMLAK